MDDSLKMLPPLQPLISTNACADLLADSSVVPVFARSNDPVPGAALAEFRAGHLPRARFLDLELDLADLGRANAGRHPLPAPERFAESLRRSGIGAEDTVIAYDDATGSQAARLWWMLRWIGHRRVVVLDGGFAGWVHAGLPVEHGDASPRQVAGPAIIPLPDDSQVADIADVEQAAARGLLLVDARSAERFRGEVEPFDAVAGHIPGAINLPYMDNLHGDPSLMNTAADLRARFAAAGIQDASRVICYCGSGVTACHNLLALELAGLSGARLYPGSWSEWIEFHR